MMNIWLVIFTDNLGAVIGKKFLGLNTDLAGAKQMAQSTAETCFAEYHVAEIDGIWCVEGREAESDTFSYIALYGMVKGD